jgi:hypothetical protein
VHVFPSSHAAFSSGAGSFTHPLDGLHESAVHWLLSSQLRVVPPQEPPAQWSFSVQASLSSQGAEFGTWPQAPLPLQTSSVQGLLSVAQGVFAAVKQSIAVSLQLLLHCGPPVHGLPACTTQLPPLQVSAPLQNTPSLHGSVLAGWVHEPLPLHLSSVQPLPSSVHGVFTGALQV